MGSSTKVLFCRPAGAFAGIDVWHTAYFKSKSMASSWEHGTVEVESDDEAEIAAALAAHGQAEVAWKDGEHWPGTLRDDSRIIDTVLEYRFQWSHSYKAPDRKWRPADDAAHHWEKWCPANDPCRIASISAKHKRSVAEMQEQLDDDSTRPLAGVSVMPFPMN